MLVRANTPLHMGATGCLQASSDSAIDLRRFTIQYANYTDSVKS